MLNLLVDTHILWMDHRMGLRNGCGAGLWNGIVNVLWNGYQTELWAKLGIRLSYGLNWVSD